MKIINFLLGLLKGAGGWIVKGAKAVFSRFSVATIAISIIVLALTIVVAVWLFVLPSSSQKGLKQFNQSKLGFFDTFWKQKETVEILIDGALKDAVVTPPSVNVRAGQKIAIEVVKGVVAQQPIYVGNSSILNPADVIYFTIPGKDGEFRLDQQKVTEFVCDKDGEIKFGVRYFYLNPSGFFTGVKEADGEEEYLEPGPVKLRLTFLDELTGKGVPPRKIEEIQEKVKIPGLPGIIEWGGKFWKEVDLSKIPPDTKKIDDEVKKIKEGAEKFWTEDPDGQAVQEKMKTIQRLAESAEDLVSKEVERLPKKTEQWLDKKKREEPDKLSEAVKELKGIKQKIR